MSWFIVVLLAASACAPDDGAGRDETAPDGSGPPALLVAVTTDGRVVQLDPTDGTEIAAIASGAATEERFGIALSADGQTTFVVRPLTGGEFEISSVSTGGGDPNAVVTGSSPDVHPAGGRLAYVSADDPIRPHTLAVRRLDPASERTWDLEVRPEEAPFAFLADLAWTGDGSGIAYVVGFEESARVHILDPDADTKSLWDGRRLEPDREGATWNEVASRGAAGGFAVLEGCCGPDFAEPWRILAVDAAGTQNLLLEVGGGVGWFDLDASGEHVLFVRDRTLYRWREGEPVELAANVVAAAW